jgi:hypothetical protein
MLAQIERARLNSPAFLISRFRLCDNIVTSIASLLPLGQGAALFALFRHANVTIKVGRGLRAVMRIAKTDASQLSNGAVSRWISITPSKRPD